MKVTVKAEGAAPGGSKCGLKAERGSGGWQDRQMDRQTDGAEEMSSAGESGG